MEFSAFDLDHTLLKANSSFCFGQYLFKKKILSFYTMSRMTACYAAHKAGLLSVSQIHHRTFELFFKGIPAVQLEGWVHDFLSHDLDKLIYPVVYKRLTKTSALYSSSPDFLVKPIAQRLGIAEVQASLYDIDKQGRLCDISKLIVGEDKAACLIKSVQEKGLDIRQSVAYSDSILDLPFLLAAGRGVGVNPDRRLRKICLNNQWEII